MTKIMTIIGIAGILISASIQAKTDQPGPFDEPQPWRKVGVMMQHWNIPLHDGAIDKAIFIHPNTPGPWKLVMMNHGIPGPKPGAYKDYPFISKFFLDRGYAVVLPVRQGSGATGGGRRDEIGSCGTLRVWPAIMSKAQELGDIWAYMRSRPEIQKDGAILMGKSQGGLSVLSASKNNPEGVAGIIDLAGGVITGNGWCNEPEIMQAMTRVTETARVPVLLLYTENDQNVPAFYGNDMIATYTKGNPNAKGYMFPPIGEGNGHDTIEEAVGVKTWGKAVSQFLKSVEKK